MRPFQWIGLVSYSLYLWHWPVLTIAAERRGTGSLPAWDSLLWVLVSLGLAIVTYLLMENPIRHNAFLVLEEVGKPGSWWVPDRVEPHRGHG